MLGSYWAEADDEAACAAGSGALLQHESSDSELPDGDEAAFLHKQDPGDARRVPSSAAACMSSISLTPALL